MNKQFFFVDSSLNRLDKMPINDTEFTKKFHKMMLITQDLTYIMALEYHKKKE